MRRHLRDPYVKQAVRSGFRSRAAFKLIELDERERLFRPGMAVIDLGASPGGWSQVAAERVGRSGRVIAVDVLPMEPLAGVTFLQGDVHEADVQAAVQDALGAHLADLALDLLLDLRLRALTLPPILQRPDGEAGIGLPAHADDGELCLYLRNVGSDLAKSLGEGAGIVAGGVARCGDEGDLLGSRAQAGEPDRGDHATSVTRARLTRQRRVLTLGAGIRCDAAPACGSRSSETFTCAGTPRTARR